MILTILFSMIISCYTSTQQNSWKCQCSDYVYQYDCQLNPKCYWNNTACQDAQCDQIIYQSQCISNSNCYYDKTCQTLTECSQLTGKTSEECAKQSLFCGYYNTTNSACSKFQLNECGQFDNYDDCLYTGPEFLCFWDTLTQTCNQFTTCSTLTKEECQYYQLFCSVQQQSDNITSCIQSTCNQLPTSNCTFTQSISDFTIQPCYVDTSSNPAQCQNADISDLSFVTCSLNTGFTALWNSNITTDGSCKSCNSFLLTLSFIIMIIFVQ